MEDPTRRFNNWYCFWGQVGAAIMGAVSDAGMLWHYHKAGTTDAGRDRCDKCGRDIRDKIHVREPSQAKHEWT